MINVKVPQETELIEIVQLYSEYVLKTAGNLVVTLGEKLNNCCYIVLG